VLYNFNTLPNITQTLPEILYNYHMKCSAGPIHTTETVIINLNVHEFKSLIEGEFSNKLNVERGDCPVFSHNIPSN
jgi:hypothetical protein